MAKTEHVTVTLDKEALAEARREARARGLSLSAIISESLAKTAKHRAFRAWMDVAYRDAPITDAEVEVAGQQLNALWDKPPVRLGRGAKPSRRKPPGRKAAKRRRACETTAAA